jgi:hypothetical protein
MYDLEEIRAIPANLRQFTRKLIFDFVLKTSRGPGFLPPAGGFLPQLFVKLGSGCTLLTLYLYWGLTDRQAASKCRLLPSAGPNQPQILSLTGSGVSGPIHPQIWEVPKN